MKLQIKTEKLKEMVSRAIKGASNNKLIPITSLMALELKDNTLTIKTTDATNYLYIIENKVEGDDFYVVVPVDKFAKLIARLTCETVTLTLAEKMNVLQVKGNGNYTIELPMDEDGGVIKYPDPLEDVKLEGEGTEINLSTIQTVLNSVKPSLATTLENPCYTGYYVGDRVVSTDTYKVANMDVKLVDEPMLVSPETMNLLAVMTNEKIGMDVIDNVLVFSSPDCIVYSTKMEGLEEFAITAIKSLVDSEFESVCKLSKSGLLQVLDRLSLFVGTYDKNAITLTFTKEGLQISSKSSNGVETINYIESKKFKNFICHIDIEFFVSQIKAQVSDAVTLYYGNNNAIKMVDGNMTHIVALLQEDEAE